MSIVGAEKTPKIIRVGNQINFGGTMKALTYIEHNHFALLDKP